MPEPGIYLVNSTGESFPLVTESGMQDQALFHEATVENLHPHKCPCCGTTVRGMGGDEALSDDSRSESAVRSGFFKEEPALYETEDERNKVVSHDLRVFTDFVVEDVIDYLHYCPNEDCRVWRLFPGDSDD